MNIFHRTAGSLAASVILAAALPGAAQAADSPDNVITLGAVVSVTGIYGTSGQLLHNGYDLAVDRINSMGGVKVGGKTYKLAVKYYDDESTSAMAAELAQRLIKQDKIKFVLGPYGSALTKAIAPITEENGVPLVEGGGSARDLFTHGYKYLFAVLATSDAYLTPAVDMAAMEAKRQGKSLSSVKVAIVTQNDNFSQDVGVGAVEAAKKYGMKIVVNDKLPKGLNDMTSTLTKVKALKPDLLLVSAHAQGAPLTISQMAAQHVYVPMVALTHCKDGQIVEKYGDKADYMLCASQWDSRMNYTGRWFKTAKEFDLAAQKKYGFPSTPYQVVSAADSVIVLADAIERAGTLNQKAVRDALAATNTMTVYGPVKFDAAGKNTGKSMIMYQVQHKQYEIVWPSQWANAKFIYPVPKSTKE